MTVPINPELVKKHANLPTKLSELSEFDPEAALHLLKQWGEKKMAVSELWDSVIERLSIHINTA